MSSTSPLDPIVVAALLPTIVRVLKEHDDPGCPHVPRALELYKNMRAQTLRKRYSLVVAERFLREPSHPFVSEVNDEWESAHPELTAGFDAADSEKLPNLILEAKTQIELRERMSEVIASLWLAKRERAIENPVFRVLLSFVKTPAKELESKQVSGGQRQLLKGMTRDLYERDRAIVRLERTVRKAESTQRRLEGEIEKLTSRTTQARSTAAEAAASIVQLRERVAALERTLGTEVARRKDFQTRLAQSEKKIESLQDFSRDLAEQLSKSETRELNLAGELAKERAAREAAERQLDAPARIAASHFLAEEQRLQERFAIAQGRAREETQQRLKLIRAAQHAVLDAYPMFKPGPPPLVVRRGPLRFAARGGATEIGGSAYLIELAGKRLLVDCGIRVGADLEDLGPDLRGLADVDAVLISHAHTDHIGWLPALHRVYEESVPSIYLTDRTAELLPVMMKDAHGNLKRLLATRRLVEQYSSDPQEVPEPYDERDIDQVISRLASRDFGQPQALRGDLQIRFFEAGHILGAASILIEGDGRKIFFSGDFSDFPQETVGGYVWPDGLAPDLLVIESTYGGRRHKPRDESIHELVESVKQVLANDGVALIACFALGRAQEVLSILQRAFTSGKLPRVKVYIDGLIDKIDEVYASFGKLKLDKDWFVNVRQSGWERNELIERLKSGAAIVVTTSGMMQGGPVVLYAEHLLPLAKNRLFLTGFQEESSLGGVLGRLAENWRGAESFPVRDEDGTQRTIRLAARPKVIGLSAHADQAALVAAARHLAPKHVLLVHGDDLARRLLGEQLTANGLNVVSDSKNFALS